MGNVWIAPNDGDLIRWDGSTFAPVALPPKSSERRIRALLPARDGTLWIGRTNFVVHGRAGAWRALPTPRGAGDVQALAEDAAGRVWVGTRNGTLLLVEGDTLTVKTPAELAGRNGALRTLLGTPDGALWIGTTGAGLARLQDGRCGLVTSAQGRRHNVVSQLALDPQRRLWGGGDRGFFLVSLAAITAVAEGRAPAFHSVGFGRSEGTSNLQANSGYWPNTLLAPDGQLWFATRNGIAVADPAAPGSNRVPPPVAIEQVRVDGQARLLSGAPLKLEPGVKNLSFELSAMSFTAPEHVEIRHRLDGLDTDWVGTPRDRTASYAHLAPGDYTLRVRAANNDGVWSEQDATLAFIVRPYFWQALWFQLIVAGGCLAATSFVAHRVAARRLSREADRIRWEAALDRERTRIARDMHDQVGASLTQIALLSELAQGSGQPSGHLPQLTTTARQAITDLDEIVWAVNPRHDNLASLFEYLGQQAVDLLRAAGLRCRVEFPADGPARHLPADFRHHLFLIVREALNNAVKYAGAGEVRLAAEIDSRGLRLAITDDGRGFPAASANGNGNGLANMQARAEALGGECRIASQPGAGTTITVRLPWPAPGASGGG